MQFLTTTSEGYISLFFTLALMLVLLYFMIYRPHTKIASSMTALCQ